MNQKINFILQKLNKNSQRPIENKTLFKEYIRQSLRGTPITFYNWECPPRILDKDKKGRVFLNYSVDLKKVLRGEKLDKYTEIPRVVQKRKRENKILVFLRSLDLNFRFVKIIADTNAYYITPISVEILGKKISENFLEFKNEINRIIRKEYRIKPKVYLFSKLMGKYKQEYDNAFNDILRILNSNISQLIPVKIWEEQLRYIKNHIGFEESQQGEIVNFSKRAIATYGAEGIVFDLLSKTESFSNCIWLNIEEVSERTVIITNCLRVKKRLGKLPILFLN